MARYAGRRPKSFTTALGEMTRERAYHCEACQGGFCPRDRALGMEGASLSPAVTRMVGRSSSAAKASSPTAVPRRARSSWPGSGAQRTATTRSHAGRKPASAPIVTSSDERQLVITIPESLITWTESVNPTLGRNFETKDPLEWLARMADHIPDPGRHRTLFYGHYSRTPAAIRIDLRAMRRRSAGGRSAVRPRNTGPSPRDR